MYASVSNEVSEASLARRREVDAALRAVTDPEYPDVSIVDLGLVETLDVDGADVRVGLIPTFSGCPALHMIAADVMTAVQQVDGVETCSVEWLPAPVWSVERISDAAASMLRDEYTVTLRRKDGTLRCPACGSTDVSDQSMAGPTRCRSVAWCAACRNVVEVMR